MSIQITRVMPEQSLAMATMVGELLNEIMNAINAQAFNFILDETAARLKEFIANNKYYVFAASEVGHANDAGFITMYESYSLYAQGAFGTIPELYVRPAYRNKHVGKLLLDSAKEFAGQQGWKRLEVTTPPLPQFERTLAFYEREGFAISGGRKLQITL